MSAVFAPSFLESKSHNVSIYNKPRLCTTNINISNQKIVSNKKTKKESKKQTISRRNYHANNLALLANIQAQGECLLHSLEQCVKKH